MEFFSVRKSDKNSLLEIFPPSRKILGFTLVELIVVITILAILGTIGFIAIQGYSSSARDSVRVSDMRNIEKWLEIFSITADRYPDPDEAMAFTGVAGSILQQGTVGQMVSSNIRLGNWAKDPKTKRKYTYSTFGNGKYYQLASVFENPQANNLMIPTAFAENISSSVRGNYRFDPSLPSLVVVPSSVTWSWIFDPNVCFVVDKGVNTVDSESGGCLKKRDMVLTGMDSGLVGYWNFDESGFTPESNPYWWDNFYADSSWFMHHAFNSWAIQWAWFIAPTHTGWYIWKWLYFTSGSLILWSDLDFNISDSFTISTISNLYEFINSYPYLLQNRHFVNAYVGCNYYPTTWVCPSELGLNLSIDSIGIFLTGKDPQGTNIWSFHDQPPGLRKPYLISNNSYYKIDYTINKNIIKEFLNWNKIYEYTTSWTWWFSMSNTGSLIQSNIVLWWYLSARNRDFRWVIDDVKIYNRALSDDEIQQHAKIAGF